MSSPECQSVSEKWQQTAKIQSQRLLVDTKMHAGFFHNISFSRDQRLLIWGGRGGGGRLVYDAQDWNPQDLNPTKYDKSDRWLQTDGWLSFGTTLVKRTDSWTLETLAGFTCALLAHSDWNHSNRGFQVSCLHVMWSNPFWCLHVPTHSIGTDVWCAKWWIKSRFYFENLPDDLFSLSTRLPVPHDLHCAKVLHKKS